MSPSSANRRELVSTIDTELALWKQLVFDTDMADKQPPPDDHSNVGLPSRRAVTPLTSLPASVFPCCSATTPSRNIRLPYPGAPLPPGFGVPIPSGLSTNLPASNPPNPQFPLAAQHRPSCLCSRPFVVFPDKPTDTTSSKHRLYAAHPFSCSVHFTGPRRNGGCDIHR
jgi:hypothetical protein